MNKSHISVGGIMPPERQFDSSGKKSRGFTKGGSISTHVEGEFESVKGGTVQQKIQLLPAEAAH